LQLVVRNPVARSSEEGAVAWATQPKPQRSSSSKSGGEPPSAPDAATAAPTDDATAADAPTEAAAADESTVSVAASTPALTEVAKAERWALQTVTKLESSREGQRALLQRITSLTLTELRAVQACLSSPPPNKERILLADLVMNGVGGVARSVLLAKLDLAMIAVRCADAHPSSHRYDEPISSSCCAVMRPY
jgi:hypothetical protein